jgi:hypothetical protein
MIPIYRLLSLGEIVLTEVPNPGGGITDTGFLVSPRQAPALGLGPQFLTEGVWPAEMGHITVKK